jgi:hypothetical protein
MIDPDVLLPSGNVALAPLPAEPIAAGRLREEVAAAFHETVANAAAQACAEVRRARARSRRLGISSGPVTPGRQGRRELEHTLEADLDLGTHVFVSSPPA